MLNTLFTARLLRSEVAEGDGGGGGGGEQSTTTPTPVVEASATTGGGEKPKNPSLDMSADEPSSPKTEEKKDEGAETPTNGGELSGFSGYLDSPEKLEAYRKEMGIPSNAKEYAFDLPEGVDQESIKGEIELLKKCGVDYGIHPKALSGLVSNWMAAQAESNKIAEIERENALDKDFSSLRSTWGNDFENRCKDAKKTAQELCARAGVDTSVFSDPHISANVGLIKIFAHVSKMLGEGTGGAVSASNSFASGASEASRIARDPSHPLHDAYMDVSHPNHAYANAQYDALSMS